MAIFGFKQPDAYSQAEQEQALRNQAWQDLRRDGDAGNVLLNFGLNMLANSDTKGFGQALGESGLSALNDYRNVMAARQKLAAAEQARQDTLKQNEIANKLARDRLEYDIEHGTEQNKIARKTLNATIGKNSLDAYKTLFALQQENAARVEMGLAPLPIPSIQGAPSFSVGSGGTSAKPVSGFTARQDDSGAWIIPGKMGANDISELLKTGTVSGMDPKIADLIRAEATRQGVDPTLAMAVAMQESSGNHQKYIKPNKAGAVGLFQVIPGHAAEYGMKPEDAFDLNGNIRYGIAELKKKLQLNNGDVNAALLGYNWGQGNVDSYRKTGRGVKGQSVPWEAYNYPDMVFGRITPGAKSQASASPNSDVMGGLSTPSQGVVVDVDPAQAKPAAGADAPIMIGGVEATPEWIASRQRVAAKYPDTSAGKAAKQDLQFYKDELEARRKFAKDNKETGIKQSDISGLAKEFRADISSYTDAQEALSLALDAVKQKSGAGDLALVFSYMKALDPGSVVREGEQTMARQTGGITDQFLGVISKLQNGEQLSPDVRMGLLKGAQGLVRSRERAYQHSVDYFTGRAERNGYNPLDIIYNPYNGIMGDVDAFLKEQAVSAVGNGTPGRSRGHAQQQPQSQTTQSGSYVLNGTPAAGSSVNYDDIMKQGSGTPAKVFDSVMEIPMELIGKARVRPDGRYEVR